MAKCVFNPLLYVFNPLLWHTYYTNRYDPVFKVTKFDGEEVSASALILYYFSIFLLCFIIIFYIISVLLSFLYSYLPAPHLPAELPGYTNCAGVATATLQSEEGQETGTVLLLRYRHDFIMYLLLAGYFDGVLQLDTYIIALLYSHTHPHTHTPTHPHTHTHLHTHTRIHTPAHIYKHTHTHPHTHTHTHPHTHTHAHIITGYCMTGSAGQRRGEQRVLENPGLRRGLGVGR
jgi:hypothetical protein